MRDTEHYIQESCVGWFNIQYPQLRGLLFAVPNGGARNLATGRRLKDEGVVAGVADLLFLYPHFGLTHQTTFWGLCIEMKSPKGYQSPSQKAWQKLVEAQGYKYVVCHSLDEFMATINEYIQKD